MMTAPLVKYDAACRALAEAHRVDEVKSIRDRAIAMQAYARQAKNTEMIDKAIAIRLRAERRAGELLRNMNKRGERERKGGNRKSKSRDATLIKPPTLADLGISKTQSSQWQKLAALPPEQFEQNIARAGTDAYNRLTRMFGKESEIAAKKAAHSKLIESGSTVADLTALADSGKQFAAIYADPPWPWEQRGPRGGNHSSAEHHYPLATIDAIAALPVGRLAADDCALLLWATWPRLRAVIAVIEAWGFDYKTCGFVWVKTTESAEFITLDGKGLHWGMGYITRANTEYCLLATKGSPSRLARDVHQVVLAPVGRHSEKPDEVRRRIERLFPGPYLELFARKPVDGWATWGNEIAAPVVEEIERISTETRAAMGVSVREAEAEENVITYP
jgi:N6-adenosine-specific RNA methylase IME4